VADQARDPHQEARRLLPDLPGPAAADQAEALADQVAGWADPVAALAAHPVTPEQDQALRDLLEALARMPEDQRALLERQAQEP
jgi:DNA-directed RNA polymerase specialized sigma24 family protein